MKFKLFLFIAILTSCGSMKQTQSENTKTLLVNSAKVDCMGVAPMKCYQVKFLDQKENENDPWQNMHTTIHGFNYEPGFVYKLKVKEEHLDKANLPQDVSSIKYTLVSILSKEKR
jgi:hypothetical protein